MRDVLDVGRPHDADAVLRHVREDLVQLDILLRTGPNQIVIGHPGDGEHRLPIQLRVIQAIEQVQAARP